MASAFAMIMAGGFSERLSVLTETRAEPAVPFGGKFRLIDFPLSNCVNSVLSPGVYVSPGAVVQDSVVMNDSWIGPGARPAKGVGHKKVVAGAGAANGPFVVNKPVLPRARPHP